MKVAEGRNSDFWKSRAAKREVTCIRCLSHANELGIQFEFPHSLFALGYLGQNGFDENRVAADDRTEQDRRVEKNPSQKWKVGIDDHPSSSIPHWRLVKHLTRKPKPASTLGRGGVVWQPYILSLIIVVQTNVAVSVMLRVAMPRSGVRRQVVDVLRNSVELQGLGYADFTSFGNSSWQSDLTAS